jgi:hypothetical protein
LLFVLLGCMLFVLFTWPSVIDLHVVCVALVSCCLLGCLLFVLLDCLLWVLVVCVA